MAGLERDRSATRRSTHSRHRSVSRSRLYIPQDRDRSRSRSRVRRERDRSRERDHSRDRSMASAARNFLGLEDDRPRRTSGSSSGHHSKHSKRTSSFFGLPNVSSRSFFSVFGGQPHTTSYYRRSPRSSFLHRTYRKLKRLLRDLLYYAKKHPFKVFMLAVLPLLTGGALTALLARFGVRLPPALERLLGAGARAARAGGESLSAVGDAAVRLAGGSSGAAAAGAHLERNSRGNLQWERRPERDYFGGGKPSVVGGSLVRSSAASRVPYTSSDYYGPPASSRGSHDNSWGASLSRFFS